MDRVLIRTISQEDIEGFLSCLESLARERKYLGFTEASLRKNNFCLISGRRVTRTQIPFNP